MAIALEQHAGEFTQAIIAVYKEEVPVPSFLRSFFTTVLSASKFVEIWVQRGTEKIAVDVNRGGKGRRNQFAKESQKVFLAPFYDEYFEATSLDTYDNMVNAGAPPELVGSTARDIAMKLQALRDKINRAKELQAAQVLETGIVVLVNGDNIDFKRKAGSKVDANGVGGYWTVAAATVEAQVIAAGDFIRQQGKNNVKQLNMICSGASWVALKNTNFFANEANYRNVSLMDITMPIANSAGATYNGQFSAGSYVVNVWVYDETYVDDAGATQRFLAENQTVFLPVTGYNFKMAHAGLPTVINDPARVEFPQYISNIQSEFGIYENIDTKRFAHEFGVMSAPVAVPVTVDMIYTLQTLA